MAPPPQPPRELTYLPLAEVCDDTTFRLRQPGEVSSLAQSIAQVGQLFPIEARRTPQGVQPITGFRRLKALRMLHRQRVLVRLHPEIPDEVAALVAAADAIDSRSLELEELGEMHERYRAMGWGTKALDELIARAATRVRERLEDLEARFRGEEPPDRSVEDEDGSEADAAAALMEAAPAEPRLAKPPAEAPRPAPLGAIRAAGGTGGAEAGGSAPPATWTADALAGDLAVRFSEITQDLAALTDHWSELPANLRGILVDQLTYYSRLGDWLARAGGERP